MSSQNPVAESPKDLAQRLAPGQRLLGIDLGSKTIGLAVSDAALMVASAVMTLKRTKLSKDSETLAALITERDIGGLVVGLPINMDGSEGPRAQATRDWARELAQRICLPITFWDERMSTMVVERAMIEANLSRAKRAKRVDEAAAAYILQGALDGIGSLQRPLRQKK